MVFESVVSNLLNRFLGDYVENLDSSQLNIGIWGGDVVLNNLNIKSTALDNMDLPIKLKTGYLHKLTLKIPWKNLYNEPVIAEIDGLYILAVPNLGIKYDQVKEEKYAQDAKQTELARIEEARKARKKQEAEKSREQTAQDDSFAEKMVTQVIKNLQVTIKNIHVRYEDQFTNRKRPFSLGVTLGNLFFQTTDQNWKPCIIKDAAVKLFYKLVDLDSLSFYWDSGAKLISEMENRDQMREAMVKLIATKQFVPQNITYILAPICISAKLRLNQKPESDGTNFKTPKVLLNLDVDKLEMHIGKYQYQDILEFLEAQERLNLNAKYRKYRPDLRVYKKHSKEWWRFAYKCILEENVKRRRQNWSWTRIKQHRDLVKLYKTAWIEKLTNKNASKETTDFITEVEKTLNVFNLNIARQQAETEIDKRGLTRIEDQQGWVGWMSGFLGGGAKTAASSPANKKGDEALSSQFEKAMTDEERAKLYEAIDYHENQTPATYPKEFVENKILFSLKHLALLVHDDVSPKQRSNVLSISLNGVSADVEQRPSAQAINVIVKMKTFTMDGMKDEQGNRPVIASSADPGTEKAGRDQVFVQFETNPVDGSFDQIVQARFLSQNVVYHAPSINKLSEVFRPPESVRLKQLTAAAFAKYDDIKERSATGLSYALEKQARVKIDVDIQPTCVQIHEGGVYDKRKNALVLDLGSLKIKSQQSKPLVQDESFRQKSESERVEVLLERAYDKFDIQLRSLQLLFVNPNDDYLKARAAPKSDLHILQPTGFDILIKKATIADLRLPQLVVEGTLPDINLATSDKKLLQIFTLLFSIPTPPPPPPGEVSKIEDIIIPEPDRKMQGKMHAIMETMETNLVESGIQIPTITLPDEKLENFPSEKKEAVSDKQINVQLKMILNQITVNVSQEKLGLNIPYMFFNINGLNLNYTMKPLDAEAKISLANIELVHCGFNDFKDNSKPLFIVQRPETADRAKPLFLITFVQADRKNPDFHTQFKSIEQNVTIDGQPLIIAAHREALMDAQKFTTTLQQEIDKIKPVVPKDLPKRELSLQKPGLVKGGSARESNVSIASISLGLAQKRKERLKQATGVLEDKIINLNASVALHGLIINIGTCGGIITVIDTSGLDANVEMKLKTMSATVVLRSVSICDPRPGALYKKILSVVGEEVLRLEFIQFNRSDDEKSKIKVDEFDMGVKLKMTEMRFVFLNCWISELLAWVAPFQDAATAAAGQARQAVTDSAKGAAAVFQEQHVSKMKLDVNINAPVVLVPQNSKSREALLADFGRLLVQNSFSSSKHENGNLIVNDNMKVILDEMQLARVILDEDGWQVKATCHILDPITFTLTVSRNLSFGWFKEIPEMVVSAKLPQLKVSVSQEDYNVAMKVLSENFAEVPPQPCGPPHDVTSPSTKLASAKTTPSSPEENSATEKSTATARIVTADTHGPDEVGAVKIQFYFEIDEICGFLYSGSSNLTSGIALRNKARAFAGVQIIKIVVRGDMQDDNAMKSDVFLSTIIMDDCRIDRTGITRLMDKKHEVLKKGFNLVDIKYVKKADGNQLADIKMRPFFFCVCPEFLGALLQFFAAPPSPAPPPKAAIEAATLSRNKRQASGLVKTPAQKEPPVSAVMEVNISIDNPEILLVENAAKPEETLALILHFDVNLNMKQQASGMELEGGVNNLEIFSSYFDHRVREKYKKHILNPCHITATQSTDAEGDQQINIDISNIYLKISPSVIRLLSAVSAGMTFAQQQVEQDKIGKLTPRFNIWDIKPINRNEHWFLSEVLAAEEATEDLHFEEVAPLKTTQEEMSLTIKKIVFTLEADVGAQTVPMIFLTSSVEMLVSNWTWALEAQGNASLQMSYYNEDYNVWEPLVEPLHNQGDEFVPWEITLSVRSRNEYEKTDEEDVLLPPKMSITLLSPEMLNITFSKTCLRMLTKLGDAFNAAVKQKKATKLSVIELDSAFVVNNQLGLEALIFPSETLLPPQTQERNVLQPLKTNAKLPMYEFVNLTEKAKVVDESAISTTTSAAAIQKINIKVGNFDQMREINVSRAEKRCFSLPKNDLLGKPWRFLADIGSHYGRKLITLSSLVRVKNWLPMPVEVFYKNDTNLECCGTVDVEGEMNLPVEALYAATGALFFKPRDEKYEASTTPVIWHNFSKEDTSVILECTNTFQETKAPFYMKVVVNKVNVLHENTTKLDEGIFAYEVNLRPPLTFFNVLPHPVSVTVLSDETCQLKSGENKSYYNILPDRSLLEIKVFAESDWFSRIELDSSTDELKTYNFTSRSPDGQKLALDLGIRSVNNAGCREISLYCPFWMVNKTGLDLTYKADLVYLPVMHKADNPNPVLFSFSQEDFFKSKKASVKIADSEFSDQFPVDTVGSAGSIICKTKIGRSYNVSLTIQLGYSGLTKICTFTPFYLVDSRSKVDIEIKQDVYDHWLKVPPMQCVSFWPEKFDKSPYICVRYSGTPQVSSSFSLGQSFESFVPSHNEYVGFNVACNVSENSVVLVVNDFEDGLAPVLIMNDTTASVLFGQKDLQNKQALPPRHAVLFSWEKIDANGSLIWSCGDVSKTNNLYSDGSEDFKTPDDKQAWWVSFLDGRQRVLLITLDPAVMSAVQAYEAEQIDRQIVIALQGIGISLVDNNRNAEIAYIAMMSSGAIWEVKKNKFKAVSLKENREYEEAFEKYIKSNKSQPKQKIDKVELDFQDMKQLKPQERHIRRTFSSGFWLMYKTSVHQQHIHVKLAHFQIDNHLPACVFPIVFSPVPPPKSVAAESIPKPFVEFSYVARRPEHSSIVQVKYFKVLVQEVALQADQGFINAMLGFVSSEQRVSHYSVDCYEKDCAIVNQRLESFAIVASTADAKAYYDNLHFSPIKLHLSFSQGGNLEESTTSKKPVQIQSEFVNLLLKSVGVTLTEIQDVVFKLAFFERQGVFLTQPQMVGEVSQHYAKQAVKQLYVLVLGLDIIGNPFGLVRDLTTGVETLFYEPFQGAVQGPGEFAEGLALGVKSLFGHTVGGAAGAVSRITGTFGKGLAALTMDEEYQKKRQEMMNRRPVNATEGFMQGGKGLVMGVYEGITGVVTKPMEGAKKEGVSGFAKGLGTGLVGVVTRPVSGLVDFASNSLDTIRKVADVSTEVKKLRPPRLMYYDKIIRPYKQSEAEGNQMLQSIEKGKYRTTDYYFGQAYLTADHKYCLIVTDRRIMLVSTNELFGSFDVDWEYTWDKISKAPFVNEQGLNIPFKVDKKKFLGLLGSSSGKLVHFEDFDVAREIEVKCQSAFGMQG